MHLLATCSFLQTTEDSSLPVPLPKIIYNISTTWKWLVQLPLTRTFPLPLPSDTLEDLMTVKYIQNRQKPGTMKEKS